jgi:hypothetical protein
MPERRVAMAISDAVRPIKRGMIRGRESRNQNLNTKLTETEFRGVERASAADGKTTGEWLRDLALRRLGSGANDIEIIALSELVGVRLLLVNVLRSLATGQKLSAEAFDKLLDDIGATKHELATKLVAERRR